MSITLIRAALILGPLSAVGPFAIRVLQGFGMATGPARIVHERNRRIGGGVTGGIKVGLELLADLRGEMAAKMPQLVMENGIAPPFNTGHPNKAGQELVGMIKESKGRDLNQAGIAKAKRQRGAAAPA